MMLASSFDVLPSRILLSASSGTDNMAEPQAAAAIALATTTTIAAPTNLAAAGNDAGTVTLTWAGTNINQAVLVQRSMDAGLTWTDLVTLPGSDLTYTDSAVSRSTLYAYRLKASTFSASSDYTAQVTITTGPAAVTSLLKTAVTTTSVSLSWTAVAGATGYSLEQSAEGGDYTPVLQPAAGTTTATITGLDAGTVYAYRIRATNTGGVSPATNLSGAKTVSLPPTNLTVAATTAGIQISFTPSKGATSYIIERSSTGRPFQTLITLTKNQTSYTDTLTPESDTYSYRVIAVSEAGNSDPSDVASVTKSAAGQLPVPYGITASAGDKGATVLSFKGPTNVNYRVDQYVNSAWKPLAVVPAGSLSASLKLKTGTTTQVQVVATDGALSGIPSDSISVSPAPTPIKKVTTLKTDSATSFGLTWTGVPGATKYKVERSSDNGATWQTLSEASAAAYVDETIALGSQYQYRVSAGNDTGYSAPSKPLLASTAPNTPDLTLDGNTLSWADVSGESSYLIEGSLDGITWKKAATAKANATSATLKKVTFAYYRITALSKSGNSAPSDFVAVASNNSDSSQSLKDLLFSDLPVRL